MGIAVLLLGGEPEWAPAQAVVLTRVFGERLGLVVVTATSGVPGENANAPGDGNAPGVETLIVSAAAGPGATQKRALTLAADRGLAILAVLPAGDGLPLDPLPDLVAPFEQGQADAALVVPQVPVSPIRRLVERSAGRLAAGMLSADLPTVSGAAAAYRLDAVRQVPFRFNDDGPRFAAQLAVQLAGAGKRVVAVPVVMPPTWRGGRPLRDVVHDLREVAVYRLATVGFGTPEWVPEPADYAFKEGDGSSHIALLDMLSGLAPSRVLDLGCSAGLLAEQVRAFGHYVTGVDYLEHPGIQDRTDRFLQADLSHGIPAAAGDGYDIVIAGDVIEHLPAPAETLMEIRRVLRPHGELLLSVPNFGHWYSRTRVALGMFGYDRRGILDQTHLRFFTLASLRAAVTKAGFVEVERRATGLPLGTVAAGDGRVLRAVKASDRALVEIRPTLFAYQHVLRLVPRVDLDAASAS